MSNVTRCANGVIGDAAAFNRLRTADTASVLLLSDTHGALDAVRWIFSAFGRICDACLFAGDGAVDIFSAVREAAAGVLTVPPVIVMVQGNCDSEKYPAVLSPNGAGESLFGLPSYQRKVMARRCICLAHGHLERGELEGHRLSLIAKKHRCSIAIRGHTHVQAIKQFDSVTVINPGSPVRPRGTSYGGFAVLSLDNTHDRMQNDGTVRFYRLIREGYGTFSAAVHSVYSIPLTGGDTEA